MHQIALCYLGPHFLIELIWKWVTPNTNVILINAAEEICHVNFLDCGEMH